MGHHSLQHVLQSVVEKFNDEGSEAVPNWVYAVLVALMVVYVQGQISISYAHGSVVPALAMVEDTSPTAIVRTTESSDEPSPPPYTDDPDAKAPAYSKDEELFLVQTKPITSSNIDTVKHLKAIGGRRAIFRGLGVALLYGGMSHVFAVSFSRLIFGHKQAGTAVSFVLAQVVMFRWNMLWTHVVISKPSTKWFYQRLIPHKAARKAVLPTLAWAMVHAAIPVALVALTKLVGLKCDLHHLAHKGKELPHFKAIALVAGIKAFMILGVAAGLLLLVYLPVNVALTRVQAALLSEEEEPIVPFDRTYGGRLDIAAKRGQMRTAWTSFDWNSRVRLVKVYLRTVMYQVILSLLFFVAVLCTVGPWVYAVAKQAKHARAGQTA